MKITKDMNFSVRIVGLSRSTVLKLLGVFEKSGILWRSGCDATQYYPSNTFIHCERGRLCCDSDPLATNYSYAEFMDLYCGKMKTFVHEGKVYRYLDPTEGFVANSESELKKNIIVSDYGKCWNTVNIIGILPMRSFSFMADNDMAYKLAAVYVKDLEPKTVEMTVAEIEAKLGVKNLKVVKG